MAITIHINRPEVKTYLIWAHFEVHRPGRDLPDYGSVMLMASPDWVALDTIIAGQHVTTGWLDPDEDGNDYDTMAREARAITPLSLTTPTNDPVRAALIVQTYLTAARRVLT